MKKKWKDDFTIENKNNNKNNAKSVDWHRTASIELHSILPRVFIYGHGLITVLCAKVNVNNFSILFLRFARFISAIHIKSTPRRVYVSFYRSQRLTSITFITSQPKNTLI